MVSPFHRVFISILTSSLKLLNVQFSLPTHQHPMVFRNMYVVPVPFFKHTQGQYLEISGTISLHGLHEQGVHCRPVTVPCRSSAEPRFPSSPHMTAAHRFMFIDVHWTFDNSEMRVDHCSISDDVQRQAHHCFVNSTLKAPAARCWQNVRPIFSNDASHLSVGLCTRTGPVVSHSFLSHSPSLTCLSFCKKASGIYAAMGLI